jgi:hypothetical protein
MPKGRIFDSPQIGKGENQSRPCIFVALKLPSHTFSSIRFCPFKLIRYHCHGGASKRSLRQIYVSHVIVSNLVCMANHITI